MSFRASRTRTSQPMPSSHRRSLSSSRAQGTNSGSVGMNYNYNGTIGNYATPNSASIRSSSSSFTSKTGNTSCSSLPYYHQSSPYTSVYSSRENLYSSSVLPASSSSGRSSSGYLSNSGNSSTNRAQHKHHQHHRHDNHTTSASTKRQISLTHEHNGVIQQYELHHQHHQLYNIALTTLPYSYTSTTNNDFSPSTNAYLVSSASTAAATSNRKVADTSATATANKHYLSLNPLKHTPTPLKERHQQKQKEHSQQELYHHQYQYPNLQDQRSSQCSGKNLTPSYACIGNASPSNSSTASSSCQRRSMESSQSSKISMYSTVHGGGGGSCGSGGSVVNTSLYNTGGCSDRYHTSYGSNYDNGVTTASLSFNVGGGGGGSGVRNSVGGGSSSSSSLCKSNSFKSGSGNMTMGTSHSSYLTNIGLRQSKPLSTSSGSLSSGNSSLYTASPSIISSGSCSVLNSSTAAMMALASRSNSLREQERKSRTRSRTRNAVQRSLSASSEKSEGYEVRL